MTFYKRAVELDPNFAMAYARIAVHYGNQQQVEAAKPYVEKAYELRDRVSERERLYITEKYYTYITGEIEKTIETLQTWARLYPNDFIPHNNLSFNYKLLGSSRRGAEGGAGSRQAESEQRQRTRQSGRAVLLLSDVLTKQSRRSERRKRSILIRSSAHSNNYFFAFLRRDQAAMDREVQWAKGRPEEAEFTVRSQFDGALFRKGEAG